MPVSRFLYMIQNWVLYICFSIKFLIWQIRLTAFPMKSMQSIIYLFWALFLKILGRCKTDCIFAIWYLFHFISSQEIFKKRIHEQFILFNPLFDIQLNFLAFVKNKVTTGIFYRLQNLVCLFWGVRVFKNILEPKLFIFQKIITLKRRINRRLGRRR